MLALGPFDTRADEQTWQCQKPTPSFSSMAKSFFAKHASHTLGRGSPPISHHEQFEHRQATLLHQMEQGIGQMAMCDASSTPPPSHKRVLIWRAITIQGILLQALTKMRIGLHMVYIEVLVHSSFFLHFLARVSGLLRPSSDGSAISVINVNTGLEGASRRKPRDDYHDQLDRRGFALQTWSLAWRLSVFWQTFHWERSRF